MKTAWTTSVFLLSSLALPLQTAAQDGAGQAAQGNQAAQATQSAQADQAGQANRSTQDNQAGQANQGQQQNPYEMPDGSFISLSGTVASAFSPESFVLNFGEGQIEVEMDGPGYAAPFILEQGDKVTVFGRLEEDLFESSSIEAGSLYVERLSTRFYASTIDDEDFAWINSLTIPVDLETTVMGRVAQTSRDSFTLESGQQEITVKVDELASNPLDADGAGLQTGDVVSVSGQVDEQFLTGREIVADTLVKIHNREAINDSQASGDQQSSNEQRSNQRTSNQQSSNPQTASQEAGSRQGSTDGEG